MLHLLKNIFHKGHDLLNIIYGIGLHLFLETCLWLQFFSKKVSIAAIFHCRAFLRILSRIFIELMKTIAFEHTKHNEKSIRKNYFRVYCDHEI